MNLKHVIKKQNSKVDWAIFRSEPPPPKWARVPFLELFFCTFCILLSIWAEDCSKKIWDPSYSPPLFQKCLTLFGQGLNPPPLLGIAQI